ncbi:Hypothetical predicted protein [Cloeon dipterum]|uniref:Uncharacterized protein n=1 Tax=Cloeon dipterum TaxID=197152 RepID=A0A8S1E3I6_9INSE|nr:Hypothetical predicted protein [Cloeon dipterum]
MAEMAKSEFPSIIWPISSDMQRLSIHDDGKSRSENEVKNKSNSTNERYNPLLVMMQASDQSAYANCYTAAPTPYYQIVTNAANMSGGTVTVKDGSRVIDGVEWYVMGNNKICEKSDPNVAQQETPNNRLENGAQKRKRI